MPVEHPSRPDVYAREHAAHPGDDYAERRHVVMERARELKRALLQSTMRLSSGRAAAAWNEAGRRARAAQGARSPWLRICVALLTGALSMLIPFPRIYSLQGQLAAADGTEPWVMVYAHPAQCAELSLDASSVVVVDAPGQLETRHEAQIARLAPHEGSAEAPTCHIALQLLDPTPLPADAAISVLFATQSRTWLAVLMDKADDDSRVREASTALRSYTQFAWHHGGELVSYVAQHPQPQHYWGMLKQLLAQDEADSAATD